MPEPDPFDTAGLRAAVLSSWAASPTRFREDANAEEDLLLGGYGPVMRLSYLAPHLRQLSMLVLGAELQALELAFGPVSPFARLG